ncbi:MAG: GNAT family N-acetyltransferase [Verrucomicrobia bacterium]|nr:GNAT family N-acetyltransferase [Verrucomicrobiota bacterium]
MSCYISDLSRCSFCTNLAEPVLPSYAWAETIYADDITFRLVTSADTHPFVAICDMYQVSKEELAEVLKNMALWCIYNAENQPVGAIQLDLYSTLENLKKQVSDQKLVEYLFSSERCIELSYALTEQNRGKGLGSKVVAAFINHARSCEWGKHLFAVVSEDNQPSIRILEKNNFSYIGNYQHDETNENIRLYAC